MKGRMSACRVTRDGGGNRPAALAHRHVLGFHDDIWTPSGFIISPVVGLVDDPGTLTPNPVEVARIFTVPLSFFAEEGNVDRQTLRYEGVDREVFFYSWGGETIWGATALMLRNLLGLLGMIDHDAQRIA
jgi:hypothetical protein